jgi:peptidoglycan hydrolase CwlO-like protein
MVDKIAPTVDAIVEVVKSGEDIAKDIKKTDEIVKSKEASTGDKIVASIATATHLAGDLAELGAKVAPVIADDAEAVKGCFACCLPSPGSKRRKKRVVPYSPSDDKLEDAEAPARKKKKSEDEKKKGKKRVSRTLSSMDKTVVTPTKHAAPPSPLVKGKSV